MKFDAPANPEFEGMSEVRLESEMEQALAKCNDPKLTQAERDAALNRCLSISAENYRRGKQ